MRQDSLLLRILELLTVCLANMHVFPISFYIRWRDMNEEDAFALTIDELSRVRIGAE